MTSGLLTEEQRINIEKFKNEQQNALCGDCLHSRDAHTKHNGHFMYCSNCFKLCDIDEFYKIHPVSKRVIMTNGLDKFAVELGDNENVHRY